MFISSQIKVIDTREQIISKTETQKEIISNSDNREFDQEFADLERRLKELRMVNNSKLEKREARRKKEHIDIT